MQKSDMIKKLKSLSREQLVNLSVNLENYQDYCQHIFPYHKIRCYIKIRESMIGFYTSINSLLLPGEVLTSNIRFFTIYDATIDSINWKYIFEGR